MDGSSQTEHEASLPEEEGARRSFSPNRGEGHHPAERPGQHEQAFSHFDQDDEEEATQIDHAVFEVADLPTEIAAEFPQNPVLVCIKGKDSGKDFTLQNGANSVGRSLDNDIILSDVSVSRRHFELSWDGQGAKLRDLGSGNGTQLNGSRVHEAALEDNDVVSAGETEFRFRTPEGVLGQTATGGAGAITAPSSQMAASPLVAAPAPGGFAPPPAPGGFAPPPAPGGFAPPPAPGGFAPPLAPAAGISTRPKDRFQSNPLAGIRASLGDKFWLVVGGGLFLLVGLIITTYTYVSNVRKAEEVASQNAAVDQAFQQGVTAYQERDFDVAHDAFDAVLRVRPSHEEAREFMRRASQAKEDQQKLLAAQNALLDDDPRAAKQILEGVDRNSEFARDFSELRIKVRRVEVLRSEETKLQEALREGDLETAKRAFVEVQRLDADEASLAAYRTALDTLESGPEGEDAEENEARGPRDRRRSSSRTSSSRASSRSSSSPRRVARKSSSRSARGSGGGRAMSLYAAGRFSDAAKAADADLASNIRSFETYYKKASSTPSRRNLSSLREAVRLDKKISGGKFASKLKPKLVEALLDDAKFRLNKEDDAKGCARVREAKTHDPSHRETSRLERLCVGRAIRLAKKAKSMERSNPSEARTLYRRVLSMGPDSSLRRQVMDSLRRLSSTTTRDDDE